MKKIIYSSGFIILLIIGLYLYYQQQLKPVNINIKSSQIFVINRGESINNIVNNLNSEKLIRNRIAFYLLIKQLRIESHIQAGDFRLSPSMSSVEIAQTLTKGTLDVWITLIEGWRKEEVAQTITKQIDISVTEFIKQAREGYLFPDTYLIPKDASLGAVLSIIYKNFDNKYNNQLKSLAVQKKLSDHEVITLASIVEREARSDTARQQVASILLKRWQNGWGLEVDASIQYIIGYQSDNNTWWKKFITNEDKLIASPYNTYKNPGLPPGPICNPSLSSIKAVLSSDPNTPYWFYLTSRDGSTMHYAKTLSEHNQNISKYLR